MLQLCLPLTVCMMDGNCSGHVYQYSLYIFLTKAVITSDAGRDLCSVEDRNGNTPLHSSCAKGDVELVKVSYLYGYVMYCM